MSETRLIIDQLKFSYEGIFDLTGLYRLIDSFFYGRSYDRKEKMNTEMVTPSGRQIKIELDPWKSITDYFKVTTKIRIHGQDIKSVDVDKDGAKVTLSEGKIMIIIDGYVVSDKGGKWESGPFFWFLRIMFDKFIFKYHYHQAEQWLISDIDELMSRIKTFLNVYRAHERGLVSSHTLN